MIKLSTQFGDQTQRLNNYASGGGGCCCCCSSCVVTLVGFTIISPIILNNAIKVSPKTLTIEQDEVEISPLYDQNNDQQTIEQSEKNQLCSVPMTDTSNIHPVKNTAWIITNILVVPLLIGFFILATKLVRPEFPILGLLCIIAYILTVPLLLSVFILATVIAGPVFSAPGLLCIIAYIAYCGFVYEAHGKNSFKGSVTGLLVLLVSFVIAAIEFFIWLHILSN